MTESSTKGLVAKKKSAAKKAAKKTTEKKGAKMKAAQKKPGPKRIGKKTEQKDLFDKRLPQDKQLAELAKTANDARLQMAKWKKRRDESLASIAGILEKNDVASSGKYELDDFRINAKVESKVITVKVEPLGV